ncbi:MAG: hypothetical protein S4CHLAM102_05370 [Chlamydiia bacterium]|nr:hypothetical protein [Chlamydiia bacterium]
MGYLKELLSIKWALYSVLFLVGFGVGFALSYFQVHESKSKE